MKNLFIHIFTVALICILLFSFNVNAAGERVTTSDVTVKTGRLFEVKIGLKSSRTVTAARFTLTYNPDEIAARKPVCSIKNAEVRFSDKNGTTDIIFLCSDGAKCSEHPTLFTMKYKKLTDNDTKVTIEASDCVDNNLNNFTPPQSALCSVKADGSAGSRSDGSSDKSSDDSDSSDSENSDDSVSSDDAAVETTEQNDLLGAAEKSGLVYKGEENPYFLRFVAIFIILIIVTPVLVILGINKKHKNTEKKKEEEKNQNNKED